MPDPPGEITRCLHAWNAGDPEAFGKLVPLVYDELRRIAGRKMAEERNGHTLQPTALVHEAYIRLLQYRTPAWRDRMHFFGSAASLMRRILVDYARKRHSARRGDAPLRVKLPDADLVTRQPFLEWMMVDEALDRLTVLDPLQARVVELHYFGGLTVEETAEILEVSPYKIERQWTAARAWIARELARGEP
ncbi:MAG: sigma-70 family RNA polymerase sigma factor [Acidobacteria bacterium]|nr:sigma-70 family RNA polymerase sigma factor [Acidobacteriota bacterium]